MPVEAKPAATAIRSSAPAAQGAARWNEHTGNAAPGNATGSRDHPAGAGNRDDAQRVRCGAAREQAAKAGCRSQTAEPVASVRRHHAVANLPPERGDAAGVRQSGPGSQAAAGAPSR